ncbi:MAG TPA: tetratricopeptide repeat protein [Candidatus Polarisedimenticolaceae bacterium]|nr:tetratricopeptide repeat protein [Candidatus Polarisedimenticolaceae bacterium]
MKRTALWVLGLAVLAVLPYVASLHDPLIYDDRTILDNRWLVREAGPVSVFQHDYWYGTKHESSDLYRPLTVLSLAANGRIATSREGFRVVNIALHALATLAVAWMLVSLVSRRAAWIGAAIFAVHPLASESVLWVVGRAEIAAAILGMIAFTLFVKLDGERGPGGLRLTGSVAAFFAALCFKESAAAWIAIGAAWLVVRPRAGAVSMRVVAVRGACYAGTLVAFLLLRASVVGWARHDVPFVDNPLVAADAITRAANAVLLFGRYLLKMVWPGTLTVDYGFDQIRVEPILPWAGAVAVVLVAAAIATVAALFRRGRTSAAFMVAFLPCAFAVTGNLAFPIGTIFGERLAYTPLIGACGLLGLALAAVPAALLRAVTLAALLVAGGFRTAVRCGDFKGAAALSEATVAASPRSVKALYNAARTRLRQGRAQEAIPLLEQAVAIWPDYAKARQLLDEARTGASSGADDEGR